MTRSCGRSEVQGKVPGMPCVAESAFNLQSPGAHSHLLLPELRAKCLIRAKLDAHITGCKADYGVQESGV